MTDEAKSVPDLAAITALIDTKINLANAPVNMVRSALQTLVESLEASQASFAKVGESLLPVMTEVRDDQVQLRESLAELASDQNKLRGVLLSKIDGLKGTIDLLNARTNNTRDTADYVLTNSQSAREETAKIVAMILSLKTQQNVLESQVDELRKKAAEHDENL